MQAATINKMYLYYLRFVGLSCQSINRNIENLLILYNLFIIGQDLMLVYDFCTHIRQDTADINIIENLMIYINHGIALAYKVVRIFISCRVILGRKIESNICQWIEEIENDFQLKLFHKYEMSNWYNSVFYRYLWIVNMLLNVCAIIYEWQYESFLSILNYSRYLFTLHAIRAVYLQFVLIIIKIDEILENLEKCLINNLHQRQQTVGHPAEMKLFNNNQCVVYNGSGGVGGGGMSSPVNNWPCLQVRRYLLQRLWTMKCIYGKIIQISLTCSSLFGLSVLLTNFLCICELTGIMYVAVTTLAFESYPLMGVVYGLYTVLPTIIILMTMCWLSDKCSRRVRVYIFINFKIVYFLFKQIILRGL